MISRKEILSIRNELIKSKNPLFIFHNDCDGLSSFLLLYGFAKKGKWIMFRKKVPEINESFLKDIKKYEPDKIFVLDIAIVDQKFIDGANVPIIWIDHHIPITRKNVKYFNPRIKNKNDHRPVSYWCYKIAREPLWVAMFGCIGDYFVPEFINKFIKKYPHLAKKTSNPDEIIFDTKLGELVKMISFNLTGNKKEVEKFITLMTKIKEPQEILERKTKFGKTIYEKYQMVKEEYDKVIKDALKQKEDKILVYTYKEKKYGFAGVVSNELRYRTDAKLIVVAKEKGNEMICSLRSKGINILPIIEKSFKGIEGKGGGHEAAAGAVIKKSDFDKFITNLKKNLEDKL